MMELDHYVYEMNNSVSTFPFLYNDDTVMGLCKSGKKIGYSNNYLLEIQVFSTYYDSLTKNSSPQSNLNFYYFGKNTTLCSNSKTDNCFYISSFSF